MRRACLLGSAILAATLSINPAIAADKKINDQLPLAGQTIDDRVEGAHGEGHSERQSELTRKIGQMIIVGFLGDTTDAKWFGTVRQQMRDGKISGVIYLKRNIRNRKSVRAMNDALQTDAPDGKPAIIAVDQEGGLVERLTPRVGFPHTPSASRVAKSMSPREAYEVYRRMGANLAAWGFNLNLGPVVDLNTNPGNPVIGRLGRSYSADPQKVFQYASAFVGAHRENGVMTALKHFPGHGSSRGDTHEGLVDVTTTWSKKELSPFRNMIEDKSADMIMSSHVHNGKLQAESSRTPMSLSPTGLNNSLRKGLSYRGVVISDDMQMGAVINHLSLEDSVIAAVRAGNDLLIYANDKHRDINIPNKIADILTRAAAADPGLKIRINQSYQRIMALKKRIARAATDKTKTRSIARTDMGSHIVLTPAMIAATQRTVRLSLPEDTAL